MVASVIAGLALATSIAGAAFAAGDAPGVPRSSVDKIGGGTAHYCVSDYAPNVAVSVRNDKTGDTAAIRTNHRGTGCAEVQVEVDCGHLVPQPIVATGVAADGNPGTSTARAMVPGNVSPCSPLDGSKAVREGGDSLSGTTLALIVGGGAGGVLVAGAIVVVVVRRRRSAAAE